MPNINKAYRWAIQKCNQSNIGYSMNYRNQQTVGGVTYYDCSSFINYAILAGGFSTPSYAPNNNPFTTVTMGAELERLGFQHFTVTDDFAWKPGDIGVTSVHTEMCYQAGTGTAQFMGAHNDNVELSEQVSIASYKRTFIDCYRYKRGATGGGSSYSWHAKTTGAYARDSTEAIENAYLMADILMPLGWTSNAIAGILGNIGFEGGYNPWRWEGDNVQPTSASPWYSHGYGLVQFTEAGKYINNSAAQGFEGYGPNFSDKTGKPSDGASQTRFINDYADYYPTSTYPMTYEQFKQSTLSGGELARIWLYNYERPASPGATLQLRMDEGDYWQGVLEGYIPGGGGSTLYYGGIRDVLRRLIIHA